MISVVGGGRESQKPKSPQLYPRRKKFKPLGESFQYLAYERGLRETNAERGIGGNEKEAAQGHVSAMGLGGAFPLLSTAAC